MSLTQAEARRILCEVIDDEISKLPEDVAKKVKRTAIRKHDSWEFKKRGAYLRLYASDGLYIVARVRTADAKLEARLVRVMGPFEQVSNQTVEQFEKDARLYIVRELSLKETIQAFNDFTYNWEDSSTYHDWVTEQWIKEWMMRFAMIDTDAVKIAVANGCRYIEMTNALVCSANKGLEKSKDLEKHSTQAYWRWRPQVKRPTCDDCPSYEQCTFEEKGKWRKSGECG